MEDRFGCLPAARRASAHPILSAVQKVIDDEVQAGLDRPEGYESFARQVKETKLALVDFLWMLRDKERRSQATAPPGKVQRLLHYCGIGKDLIAYTVDRSTYKQGRISLVRRSPRPSSLVERLPAGS